MGAVGEQGAEMAMGAELAHKMAERKLLKEERNTLKDVEWGLYG